MLRDLDVIVPLWHAPPSMTPSAIVRECPQCSASIAADDRFVPWCPECEWNLRRPDSGRDAPTGRPGPLARLRKRLDARFAADLHRQVLGSGVGTPSRDPGRIAAYTLATLVHLFALTALVGGVWLLVASWPNPFGIVFGVAGVGFAYLARPRLGRLDRDVQHALTRQEAPVLYDLLDRVAREAGAPPVDVVLVDGDVNASFGTVGLRRTNVLTIGLPLWLALEPQERVALLAHEMGHSSNGDARRMSYVGSAITTLYEIHHAAARVRVGGGLRALVTAIAVNVLTGLVRLVVVGLIMVLESLTYRESQLAEYAADDRAARIASPVAVAGLMDKLITRAPAVRRHLESAAHRTGDLWEGLRRYLDGFPESEEERLRRLARLEGARVDATHPPTHLRKAFAVSRTYGTAAIATTDEEMDRVQAELERTGDRVAREIVDRAQAALYE
ncbi:M48 family metallopeptidase [Microtetraspora niveoalba]|uniref:M48 family metallopeptidase n=1 Tax=Microtetraspora niveoalba TaxID=46175 RepID=UPI000B2F9A43|nr:M48 family metallopeptidase [Microtetraspora niveoalba]